MGHCHSCYGEKWKESSNTLLETQCKIEESFFCFVITKVCVNANISIQTRCLNAGGFFQSNSYVSLTMRFSQL